MPISNKPEATRQRETGETDVEETGRGDGETERPERLRAGKERKKGRDSVLITSSGEPRVRRTAGYMVGYMVGHTVVPILVVAFPSQGPVQEQKGVRMIPMTATPPPVCLLSS